MEALGHFFSGLDFFVILNDAFQYLNICALTLQFLWTIVDDTIAVLSSQP